MFTHRLITLVAAMFAVCQVGLGENMEWLSKLRSADPQERDAAVRAAMHDRAESILAVETLITESVNDQERRGTVGSAIVLLGELRSERSIPLLVQNLTYRVFYKDVKRPQPPSDLFPAIGALIKIGIGAVDPVIERATQTDDEAVLRNSAAVLRGVLGTKLATYRIEIELKRQPDRLVKSRIEKLLTIVSEAAA